MTCGGGALAGGALVGGPAKEPAEVVLAERGANWLPMAVFSSCCTTGLIESRCSFEAYDVLEAEGAFLISIRSALTTDFRLFSSVVASFSVHRYTSNAWML
jgi:hypothetical protein